jgi:hypothetical protein
MRLKKADSASVLWTRAGEIVRHAFSSDLEVNAVASWQVPGIVRICAPWPAARGKASCTSKQLLRAGCPTPSLSADVGIHVRSAAVVRPSRSGGQDALPVHECTIPQVEPVPDTGDRTRKRASGPNASEQSSCCGVCADGVFIEIDAGIACSWSSCHALDTEGK